MQGTLSGGFLSVCVCAGTKLQVTPQRRRCAHICSFIRIKVLNVLSSLLVAQSTFLLENILKYSQRFFNLPLYKSQKSIQRHRCAAV